MTLIFDNFSGRPFGQFRREGFKEVVNQWLTSSVVIQSISDVNMGNNANEILSKGTWVSHSSSDCIVQKTYREQKTNLKLLVEENVRFQYFHIPHPLFLHY